MTHWLGNRWWVLLLRFAVGTLFGYAGWTKILDPQQFADSIHTFQIFRLETINLIAICLPPLEFILGALLVVGWNARTASGGIFFLTVFFMLVIGQAALRGLPVDCGCFGSGPPSIQSTYLSLARTLGLVVVSFNLYRILQAAEPQQVDVAKS